MDEIKMEREIKEMLHQCADELHAPDSMQARVKFALNNAPAPTESSFPVSTSTTSRKSSSARPASPSRICRRDP